MKALLAAIVLLLVVIPTSVGHSAKEEPVKYQVSITITYNAVTAEEAARLTKEMTEEHGSACSVKIVTTKNGSSSGMLVIGNSDNSYILTN